MEIERARPVVYAALGASDTLGVGADDPDTEGWVDVFHRRLPPGSVLHRFAASGATAAEALADLVPGVEESRPDLITVWLAVNDLRYRVGLDEYLRTLDEILRRTRATGAQVLVGNLPDLVGMSEFDEYEPHELRALAGEWNGGIGRLASRYDAILVDLMSASEEIGDAREMLVAEDRFHPSTLGHLALAEIFFHYLESSLPATWGHRLVL